MKTRRVQSMVLIAAAVLTVGILGGCPSLLPGPESVLNGTWELVPSDSLNSQLTHWYLTFDSKGDLSRVEYTFADLTTVTWNDPAGSVSVNGDQVHVSSTQSGNDLMFDGTLDSETEPTIATGSLTSNLVFGDVQISVSQGEAILVKQ